MALPDLFSDSNERAGADAKIGGLYTGLNSATPYFQQGRDALTSYGNNAVSPYASLFGAQMPAVNTYANASGANGAQGIADAGSLFRSMPGYQGGFNQGMQGVDRGSYAAGRGASGINEMDRMKFASDYDAQKYGQFMQGLTPLVSGAQNSAGGIAGANLATGAGLNANLGNTGLLNYQTHVGVGNTEADFEKGKDASGMNILGAVLGIPKLLSGGASGMSSVAKLFG